MDDDVNRLLETRAREILSEAILKGMEAPSEFESRAAHDDAKTRALRAEAALEDTMKRWEEIKNQLDNHKALIDPAKAEASRELDEQRAVLRMQAAAVRQALEDHGIDRDEFNQKLDANDALDAEIHASLLKLEEALQRKAAYDTVLASKKEETSDDVEIDVEME